jgi:hypothetical protein
VVGRRLVSALGRVPTVASAVLVTTALLTVGLSSAAGATSSTPGATQLYQDALGTTKNWSVHYASSSSGSKITLVESGDAGPASGTQRVLMGASATKLSDNATIVVIGDFTYFKGNVGALEDLAGLDASQAAQANGQWVAFASTNALFSSVVAGVRSHDIASELALKGPLSLGKPSTIGGQAVDAIKGTQKFGKQSIHVILYVRAHGSHVPVEEDSVDVHGHRTAEEHVTYSAWGEKVRPQAPQASVSIGRIGTT